MSRFQRAFTVWLCAFAFLSPNSTLSASSKNETFVVGDLVGQLGNQMFEIAATLSLAWDHGAHPYVPDLRTRQDEGIPTNYKIVFAKIDASHPKAKIAYTYSEPHFYYSPIPYVPKMKIRGYFQSEKYFIKYKKQIISLFSPTPEIYDYLHRHYADILDHPNTVSIHIRTYNKPDPQHKIYILNGYDYVSRAVKLFPKDSLFVVFSDDMAWCKKELAPLSSHLNLRFIEEKHYLFDFYLMSLCKHNIISNSSFSWWAAYLNPNAHKIVIAPSKWFHPNHITPSDTKDLLPPQWLAIE